MHCKRSNFQLKSAKVKLSDFLGKVEPSKSIAFFWNALRIVRNAGNPFSNKQMLNRKLDELHWKQCIENVYLESLQMESKIVDSTMWNSSHWRILILAMWILHCVPLNFWHYGNDHLPNTLCHNGGCASKMLFLSIWTVITNSNRPPHGHNFKSLILEIEKVV